MRRIKATSETDSGSTSETGNEVSGNYTRTETGTTTTSLQSVDYKQSQTISISQVATGTTSATTSGNTVSETVSGSSTDTSTTSVFPAEENQGDLVGPVG